MNKLLHYIFITIILLTNVVANDTHLEKVSLQLAWKHQFEFAGFYMAKEKGFYKKVGLDVELKEFTNDVNLVDDVIKQKSTFAIGYPGIIFKDIQHTVLLSAIFQSTPHVLVSLKSSNIHTIKDFANKKILIGQDELLTAPLIAMLQSNNLSFKDLQVIEPTFNIDSLVNHDADLGSYYISNELYELDKKGIAYDIWNPKDYGFDFYDNILFTSKKELENRPNVVKNFNEASLLGWEYAYTHIPETIEVIMQHYNTQHKTEGALLYEANVLKKLSYKNTQKLGQIKENKVQRIVDIFNLLKIIKTPNIPDSFIYKAPNKYNLTQEEKNYLKKKKTIKMCIDPDWMPYEKLDQNKHIGMSADYFTIIQKFIQTDIKVIPTQTWSESLTLAQQSKCDILSLVMPTPNRKKYLNFTAPYLQIPLVMATKIDAPFTSNFNQLIGKELGIPKGYAFVELLKAKYPELTIIEVQNLHDGLEKVVKGDLYGYIGTLASIGYAFQKKFTGELKISGKFDGTWDLGIGVRHDDPILFTIFQKAVYNIDEKSKQQILNNWLAIQYDKATDYKLIFQMLSIFILVLLVVLYFFYKQRKLKNELSAQKHIFEALFNHSKDAIAVLDMESNFLDVNPEYLVLTGMRREELLNTSCLVMTHDDDIESSKQAIQEVKEVGFIKNFEKRCSTKDKIIFVNISMSLLINPQRILISVRDITYMKKREYDLKLLASIDPLTKLYNRRYFSSAAEQSLELAKRDKSDLSILMIDLDKFKNINDTYGHEVGDTILVKFAQILQIFTRKSDISCRFGGEEFILLLPQTDIKGAIVIAQKIRVAVEKLNTILDDNTILNFTISIGVSKVSLEEDNNIEAVIKRADEALYDAKNSGRNQVCTKL